VGEELSVILGRLQRSMTEFAIRAARSNMLRNLESVEGRMRSPRVGDG
jgi:hypothetical protein